jgi:hypothetical protein
MNFFDPPYYEKDECLQVSIKKSQIYLNDRPIYNRKRWTKQTLEIKFPISNDNLSWSQKAIDAIQKFSTHNSIYQNRVRIIEAQFQNLYGIAYIECYLLDQKTSSLNTKKV